MACIKNISTSDNNTSGNSKSIKIFSSASLQGGNESLETYTGREAASGFPGVASFFPDRLPAWEENTRSGGTGGQSPSGFGDGSVGDDVGSGSGIYHGVRIYDLDGNFIDVESKVHTSLVTSSITQQIERCAHSVIVVGTCQHGHRRGYKFPCKRRDCPVCGLKRRRLIAWRISHGLRVLGNGAWFVGTFSHDVSKAQAVRIQNDFIRWVRKRLGYHVEYASVWEDTRNKRLHVNIVFAPWKYINQKELSEAWQKYGGGKVVWIERVGYGISKEVTKTSKKLANYLAKYEQQVKEGRGINYSKGWPKLPDNPMEVRRKGKITWHYVSRVSDEYVNFIGELKAGYWYEVAPDEYARIDEGDCDCFDIVPDKLNSS